MFLLSQLAVTLLSKANSSTGRHLTCLASSGVKHGQKFPAQSRALCRSSFVSNKKSEGPAKVEDEKSDSDRRQGKSSSSQHLSPAPECNEPMETDSAFSRPKVTTLAGDPSKGPQTKILSAEDPIDDGVTVKLVNNPSASSSSSSSSPTHRPSASQDPNQPATSDEGLYSCPKERQQIAGEWKTNAMVIDKGTRVVNSKRMPIPHLSIQDFIWKHCASFIHETMATCSLTGREYTYFMVQQASICLAAGLRIKASVLRKSTVAVILPHVPEFLIVYFGVITAGMTVVPVNPLRTRNELLSDLSVIRPSVVICASPSFNNIEDVVRTLTETGKNILLIPMSNLEHDDNGELTGKKHPISVHDLILEGSTLELPEDCQFDRQRSMPAEDEDDIAVLPYVTSSGSGGLSDNGNGSDQNNKKEEEVVKEGKTAGGSQLNVPPAAEVEPEDELPKGIMQKDVCGCFKPGDPRVAQLSHRNVVSSLVAHLENGLQLHASKDPSSKARETILSLVPLSHYYGSHMGLILTSRYGGQLIMMPLFAPDFFVSTMVKHRPTVLVIIPTLLELLVDEKAIKASHLSSVKIVICAIEKLSSDLLRQFKAKFRKGIIFKQNYAMLEAGVVCSTVNRFVDAFDACSLGGPVANMEYRVFSSRRGQPIPWPSNEFAGRIEVKGPQVMDHYWNCNHPHDCKFFNKGWYKTGDIGFFNSAGELYLLERFSEKFLVDGVVLEPKDLEGILKTHQSIKDAAILEIYLPNIGFVPHGFIVLKSRKMREQVTLSQINTYVGNIVNVPNPLRAGMHIVDRIPRRSDGRVDMAELKQLYYNTHVETRLREGSTKPDAINTV